MNGSRTALLLACALACGTAWSQSAPLAPSAAASAAERAQKETDRTMYWIRVLADKPAPAKAAPAAPKAVVAAHDKPKTAAPATPAAARTTTDVASAAPVVAPLTEPAPPAPASLGLSVPDTTAPAAPATPSPSPEPDPAPPAAAEEPDAGLVMTHSIEPEFPMQTVRRLRKGSVEVRFEVDAGGTVVDASVVKTSHTSLNPAALEAVRQWRFQPATRGHTAVVDLVFNLDH